jgi:ABC-type antimicrobial peptide transport system permease subunit
VGKRIALRYWTPTPVLADVIGVVEHQRNASLAADGRETLYYPDRLIGGLNALTYVVRSTGDPLQHVGAIRRILNELDPLLPMANVQPFQEFVNRALGPTRFALALIGLFGLTALLLAAIGLYGVLAYVARQRTNEIGIRMAFGADRRMILGLIVGQGLRLAGAGVLLGLAAAFAFTRVLETQLVGVASTDPATFITVAVTFLFVAALACTLPALRATRVHPLEALREP